MQIDFHYYATYSAAILAGYSHEEALAIGYSSITVDFCTKTLLTKLEAPRIAATSQSQMELMDAPTDVMGLQDITRIWSSFHFLPKDLYAEKEKCSRKYLKKYRLICGPNGDLVKDTVENGKASGTLQGVGIAMHVLADTWAHMYFAGTPSLVINNTDDHFYEILPDGTEEHISFRHNPLAPDDAEKRIYTSSIYQSNENNIMNLGHGRVGHLPDYGYCVYKYLPSWGEYREFVKDNPSDYNKAYRQMIYAMKYIRGVNDKFCLDTYDEEAVKGYEEEIDKIIKTRRLLDSEDWKAFGERLSGETIPDYDINTYQDEYLNAAEKKETFLGKFIDAAINHKAMVTSKIYESGSMLAGYGVVQDRGKVAMEMVKNSLKVGDEND